MTGWHWIPVVLGSVLVAGCWSSTFASDESLRPPDRPRVVEQPTDPLPKWLSEPETKEVFADEDSHRAIVDGPVTINVRLGLAKSPLLADRAAVCVDIPVGYSANSIGLAELAAASIRDVADTAGNRPSLRRLITQLGGRLSTDVGAKWTRFIATVPSPHWEEALSAIADRLQQQPITHTQFADLQGRILRDRIADWERSPSRAHAAHWLKYGGRSRAAVVAGIQDRHLAELVLFKRRHYQPRGVSIGIWVPEVSDPEAIVSQAQEAISEWVTAPLPPEVNTPRPTAEPPGGVRWVEGDGPSRLALLLPLTTVTPPWLVMFESLTMDGLGGRLGTSLERGIGRELVFDVVEIGNYEDRYAVLRTTVAPAEVPRVWQAAREAWVSLGRSTPAGSELRTAVQRAQLRLARREDRPDAWFEAAGLRAQRKEAGGPIRDLHTLQGLRADGFEATRNTWSKSEIAMVVHGGPFPADGPTEFRRFDAATPIHSRSTSEVSGSNEEAKRHLERAISALGDLRQFQLFRGYEVKEIWEDTAKLNLRVTTRSNPPDELSREMSILGTTIQISVKGTTGTETVDRKVRELSAGEADELRSEVNRHPLALLAGWAQNTIEFRAIGERSRSGRRVALLERIDPTRPRLRMTIDMRSGLVRTVETIRRRPEVGYVEVREFFDDYRRADGVRVPMHRVTTVGDDMNGVDCTVLSFKILFR